MGSMDTTDAFFHAFETADCETLVKQVGEWFEKPYRTPDNAIDVATCVASAMDAALIRREDECRRNWRNAEADRWKQARQRFDAGMRGFIEAVAREPKPEEYNGEDRRPAVSQGWVRPSPATAKGWGIPQHA